MMMQRGTLAPVMCAAGYYPPVMSQPLAEWHMQTLLWLRRLRQAVGTHMPGTRHKTAMLAFMLGSIAGVLLTLIVRAVLRLA